MSPSLRLSSKTRKTYTIPNAPSGFNTPLFKNTVTREIFFLVSSVNGEKHIAYFWVFFKILGVGEKKKAFSIVESSFPALPYFFQYMYLAWVNSNASFKTFVLFDLSAGLKWRSSLFCDELECEVLVHGKCVDTTLIGDEWCHFHVRGKNGNGVENKPSTCPQTRGDIFHLNGSVK